MIVGLVLGAPAPVTATCIGDCSGSGAVVVTDLLKMVNVALGNSPVTACAAGDASGDGDITIDEILTAVNNALGSCPTVPTETPTSAPSQTPTIPATATPMPAKVVFRLPSVTGVPGSQVRIAVTLGTGGQDVIGTLNDLSQIPEAPIAANTFGKPDCTANDALQKDISGFSFQPPGCTPGTTCTGVRALIAGFNQNPFGVIADGAVLYTCTASISASTTLGSKPLRCSEDAEGATEAFYTDSNKDDFPAGCVEGALDVVAPSANR